MSFKRQFDLFIHGISVSELFVNGIFDPGHPTVTTPIGILGECSLTRKEIGRNRSLCMNDF